MTAHANVASDQSKQEQGTEPIPRSGGARSINLGTPAKWAVLQFDWSHLFSLLSFILRIICSMRFVSPEAEENTDPDENLGLLTNP
jgi:hypothetical protein